jgi:hypothetical protein
MRAKTKISNQGDANDPWRCEDAEGQYQGSTCDVQDRVAKIRKTTDVAWLERVLAWRPGQTQTTVRMMAERRLRVLLKEQYMGKGAGITPQSSLTPEQIQFMANGKWQSGLPQPVAAPEERATDTAAVPPPIPPPVLAVDMVVMIYEDFMTRLRPEGKALLKERLSADDGYQRWRVRFRGDDHDVNRAIATTQPA